MEYFENTNNPNRRILEIMDGDNVVQEMTVVIRRPTSESGTPLNAKKFNEMVDEIKDLNERVQALQAEQITSDSSIAVEELTAKNIEAIHNINAGGSLEIGGNSYFLGNLNVDGGNLSVAEETILSGTVNCGEDVKISNKLSSKTADIAGEIKIGKLTQTASGNNLFTGQTVIGKSATSNGENITGVMMDDRGIFKRITTQSGGTYTTKDIAYATVNEINDVANVSINGLIESVEEIKEEIIDLRLFDVIIRTQAEFVAMYSSPDWLGAKSVLFVGDGGNLSFIKSGSTPLKVPDSVKKIKGKNNAQIELTGLNQSDTSLAGAIYYETKPETGKGVIEGITLKVTAIHSNFGFRNFTKVIACKALCTGNYRNNYGFSNCDNLLDCISDCSAKNFDSWQGGFFRCNGLINCTATTYSAISNSLGNYSNCFISCNNLINCKGISKHGYYTNCYLNCNYLTNCTAYGLASQTGTNGAYGTGFRGCNYLTNCTGEGYAGSGNNGAYGFHTCSYLVNCNGYSGGAYETTNTGSYGFYSCTKLNNCVGSATEGSTSVGFRNCSQLTDCTGTGFSIANGHGFFTCTQINNCIGTGKGITGYSFHASSYISNCKEGETISTTGIWGGTTTFRDDNSCQLTR